MTSPRSRRRWAWTCAEGRASPDPRAMGRDVACSMSVVAGTMLPTSRAVRRSGPGNLGGRPKVPLASSEDVAFTGNQASVGFMAPRCVIHPERGGRMPSSGSRRRLWDKIARTIRQRNEERRHRRMRPVPTPSLRHHQLFPIDGKTDGFEIRRDGTTLVGNFSASSDSVIAYYERAERKEDEATAALSTGDPRALCGLGWHRLPRPGGYFRIGTAKRPDYLIVYRIGPAPFDHMCTTIWNYSGKPIICSVCSRPGFEWPKDR